MDLSQNRISTLFHPKPVANIYGKYWSVVHLSILAHTGLMKARSGTYSDPWESQSDPIFDLPPLIYINDKLHDLMDARAVEIINIARQSGRRLYVMWSGGIDSTAVLTSILKHLPHNDADLLTVVMSQGSVDENPYFFFNYINDKIKTIEFTLFEITNDFLKNKGIVITGDPGDALMGPSLPMYSELVPTGKHLDPFIDNQDYIINSIEQPNLKLIKLAAIDGFGQWYVQKVTDNLLEVKPDGVESIADWWWWHYINLKWEASIWRPLLRRKTNFNEPLEISVIHDFVTNTFFNTDKFQQWSYSNRHRFIVNNDVETHKADLKKYIFEFDKNEEYFNNKVKVQSLPPRIFWEFPIFVNWDWTAYKASSSVEQLMVNKLEEYKG